MLATELVLHKGGASWGWGGRIQADRSACTTAVPCAGNARAGRKTWCLPCLAEHSIISRLAEEGVAVYGINHRDAAEDANRWLDRHGNPYRRIGADIDARVSIDWGVTGVPETFIIDAQGRVRHKIIGPMTPEILADEVMPLLRELAK